MNSNVVDIYSRRLKKAKDAARILNTTLPRVYQLGREVLPLGVVVRIGRQVRFDEHALLDWMAKGGSREGQEGAR